MLVVLFLNPAKSNNMISFCIHVVYVFRDLHHLAFMPLEQGVLKIAVEFTKVKQSHATYFLIHILCCSFIVSTVLFQLKSKK